jgi:hypothetical protein
LYSIVIYANAYVYVPVYAFYPAAFGIFVSDVAGVYRGPEDT